MDIEYKKEVDELIEELQEPVEEIEGDDLFVDKKEVDDLFVSEEIDESTIYLFLSGINSTLATLFSAITGKSERRYMPKEKQTKALAKQFLKLYPNANLNPHFTLVITVVLTYSSPLINLFKDLRSETGTINDSFRDERDRQDEFIKENFRGVISSEVSNDT